MLALATGSLAMHIILSLLLMRPEYFPVVFNGSVFSLSGGVSLLAGSMGAVIVASIVHRCTAPHAARMSTALKRSASAALLLMGVHAGLLGWENWFGAAWDKRHLTLLAALGAGCCKHLPLAGRAGTNRLARAIAIVRVVATAAIPSAATIPSSA